MRSHSPLQPALEIISHQFLCYPISCTRFSPHSRRRTHLRSCLPHKKLESDNSGASLVVQWLRLHCPVKRVWVQHLVRKLRPHTPCSRKTTAQKIRNIAANLIKTLKQSTSKNFSRNDNSAKSLQYFLSLISKFHLFSQKPQQPFRLSLAFQKPMLK